MMKASPLLSAALAALMPLSLGCQGGPELTDGEVQLTVTTPDGTVTEEVLPFDDVVGPALAGLPSFQVDGKETTDPRQILSGERAELVLLDGQTLVIERQGDTLTRVAPAFPEDHEFPGAVHLLPDRYGLEVEGPGGSSWVELAGIDDESLREQVMAYTAIRMLGAQMGLRGERETAQIDPGTVTIALAAIFTFGAVISYTTCVFAGTSQCGKYANAHCPGGANDVEFTTICGAGFDLQGNFQLGYHCSYRCR